MRIVLVLTGVLRTTGRTPRKLLPPGAMLVATSTSTAGLEAIDDERASALVLDVDGAAIDIGADDRCFAASKRFVQVTERARSWAHEASTCDVATLARDVLLAVRGEEEVVTDAIGTSDRIEPRVARALRYVETRHADDCSLRVLAAEAGLGVFHFLRSFKRSVGQTPCQHVMAVRLRAAARLLAGSDARVVDVAIESGFGDLSHFNATFRAVFGMQPGAYRRRLMTAV